MFLTTRDESQINEDIENGLESVYMVQWDRFLPISNGDVLRFYGWISRDRDSYKDFVVVDYRVSDKNWLFLATSSDRYSEEIGSIIDDLNGESTGHTECRRVEDSFSVSNMVELD